MNPKRLREETRAEHEATEAALPLMDPDLTREVYVRVLSALLPVVEGWEEWAAAHAPCDLTALVGRRRRGALLRSDLAQLGVGERALERRAGSSIEWGEVAGMSDRSRNEVRRRDGEARASFLGALYVMEGSRLGGRWIARHAEAVLELAPGKGTAYFRGAEDATGALWREVLGEIERIPDEVAPLASEAARRAFRAFGEAMRAGVGTGESGAAGAKTALGSADASNEG